MIMKKHSTEELDAGQLAYLGWAKANPAKALKQCGRCNRWLARNGRARHIVPAAQIKNL